MKLKQITRKILRMRQPGALAEVNEGAIKTLAVQESTIVAGSAPQEFEYLPSGWDYLRDHPEVKGWSVEDVLQVYLQQWIPFVDMVQSSRPLSGIHESVLAQASIEGHNSIMIFAYALALAAHRRTHVSLLDWGGGIGHYYLIAKALLPMIDIEYHCKDTPLFAEHGKKLFPEAFFHVDDLCLDRQYDLVFASGSLQYSQEWNKVFSGLAGATSDYLLVTRLPTVKAVPSYVFIQRPYLHGYNTEYLAWCLNHAEFMDAAQRTGLQLLREFLVGDNHPIPNAPERCEYFGFLFRKPAET